MADFGAAAERGLLRSPSFLALWGAQILSQVAANATTFALIVLVGELTKSNTSSSILILLAIAPAVAFGIVAGVIVDRSDRRLVLLATNALRAAAVVPLLFFGESVPAAYVVNFLVASITTFFVPAEAATLPSIVRKRDLLAANSLFTFTFNGAFLVGFIILAPILIRLAGYQTLFVVVGAMFGGAAILCATLPPSPPPAKQIGVDVAGEALTATRQSVGYALNYLRTAPLVAWALVYIALTYTLVAIAGALAPGFVREVLGLDERDVVVLVAPAGIGVVAGIGLLHAIGTRLGRSHAIGVGLVVTTVTLAVLAGARPLAGLFRRAATSAALGEALPFFIVIVAGTAFVFGVAYALITVPAMTLIQEELHEDMRGRIFGVLNMLVSVFSFAPLIIVGPVADVWGVAPVFIGSATIVGTVWLLSRATRTVRLGPT